MSSQAPQVDIKDTAKAWPDLARRAGGEYRIIAGFALCYLPLIWLGYQFKTDELQLTVMWPAVGLLVIALQLAPYRSWPLIIALQLACEYAVAHLMREPSMPWRILLFILANTTNGIVAALFVRLQKWRLGLLNGKVLFQFLAGTALGAAVSATLGAAIAQQSYGSESYVLQWQLWWLGNWLGTLTAGAVVLFWGLPLRRFYDTLRLRHPWQVPLYAVALLTSIWWVFGVPMADTESLLRQPGLPLGLTLAIAFALPPRWVAVLTLLATMLGAWLGVSGQNPFQVSDPYTSMLILQIYLATLATLALVVVIPVTAMRTALEQVSSSETRYRNLVELSADAVWRVELNPPMPLSLPVPEQRQWLRGNAHVAESNAGFQHFTGTDGQAPDKPYWRWQPHCAWCALLEEHLEQASRNGFQLHDLQLATGIAGQKRHHLVAFSGVVEEGQLQRIWCVARDISEIVDLNTRLLKERERLKAYAHQVVTAEERARRATAVDLHDGIGQSLTGMAMSLEVARSQAPQIAGLLDDLRAALRRVQEHTRTMIADLSPPGLYELGLEPALQWLVVHFRSKEKLRVQLDCEIVEDSIPMELRVLIFKLVRELLRNVVKHAGVDAARVRVRGDRQALSVEVQDAGRGFEWQIDMFGTRPDGFGLWSIADRVNEAGGSFDVDTQPGQGSRFCMRFPLRR